MVVRVTSNCLWKWVCLNGFNDAVLLGVSEVYQLWSFRGVVREGEGDELRERGRS